MNAKKYLESVAVALAVMLVASACTSNSSPTSTPSATESSVSGSGTKTMPDSALGPRVFVVDSELTTASYIVDEEFLPDALSKYGISIGRADTVGVTPAVEGTLALNLDDLTDPIGENSFRVDLSQLASDQSLRDQWLQDKGPQFSKYPEAVFVATSVSGAPANYTEGEQVSFTLVGDLTIREITQPAAFDVTASLDRRDLGR